MISDLCMGLGVFGASNSQAKQLHNYIWAPVKGARKSSASRLQDTVRLWESFRIGTSQIRHPETVSEPRSPRHRAQSFKPMHPKAAILALRCDGGVVASGVVVA